jgi:hypothetical protein
MMELMGNDILLCKPDLMCFLGIIAQGFSPGLKEENIRGLLSISCSLALFSQGFSPGLKEEIIRDLLSINCSLALFPQG